MDSLELINYIVGVSDYVEYSFYSNSSEIMGAISKAGIEKVFNILSISEVRKGIYNCITTWEVSTEKVFRKSVTIDVTGEMVFITEMLSDTVGVDRNEASVTIDIEKEYGEILKYLRSKSLNSIEKSLLIKVVKAFFE